MGWHGTGSGILPGDVKCAGRQCEGVGLVSCPTSSRSQSFTVCPLFVILVFPCFSVFSWIQADDWTLKTGLQRFCWSWATLGLWISQAFTLCRWPSVDIPEERTFASIVDFLCKAQEYQESKRFPQHPGWAVPQVCGRCSVMPYHDISGLNLYPKCPTCCAQKRSRFCYTRNTSYRW